MLKAPDIRVHQSRYHRFFREEAAQEIMDVKGTALVDALAKATGKANVTMNDIKGQVKERYPLGQGGPVVVVFRGEEILKFYPVDVSPILSKSEELNYTFRYEFLGSAVGAGETMQ